MKGVDKTVSHARVVDAALTRAAEACGYEGVLGDAITARRARLPARMRGLGLRSLEEVAPAAFCACFVEAAERVLDRSTPGGGRERGFFQMLAPLFGHGAFELPYPNSPRLSRFLSGCTTNVNPLGAQLGQLTPTGESFKTSGAGNPQFEMLRHLKLPDTISILIEIASSIPRCMKQFRMRAHPELLRAS